MLKREKKHEYWVTNISNKKDVSISDLRVVVRKGKSINLLDERHYKLKYDDILQSAMSGSLFAKNAVLKVSDKPPKVVAPIGIQKATIPMITRINPTAIKVEAKKFADLGDFNETSKREAEEKFALENADIIMNDNVPAIAKDEVYKNIPQGKIDKINLEDIEDYILDDE